MYHRVLLFLCILNFCIVTVVGEGQQQGYEPEFIIIQPPSPSPPADYDPNANVKTEPSVKARDEPKESSKKESKPLPAPSTTAAPAPPPPSKPSTAAPSKPSEAPKPLSKPTTTPAPEPPPKATSTSAPKPPPSPRPHPKALPQKVEAKAEPQASELPSPPSPPQADEHKSPPQNFKYSDCLSDTIFVIDSTSSVRNLFEQHRVYAHNVIKEMDISPETNHIGVVLYSSKQRQSIKVSLSDPQNKENITAKINSLPYLSGITATGAALHLTIKDLAHRRTNVVTNVVVISDGFSYDIVDEPVKELKQMSNVRIFAVSLGEAYRKFEMLMIASHEENFLTGADSYKELVPRLQQCNEGLRKGDKVGEVIEEKVTDAPSSVTQGQTAAPTTTSTTQRAIKTTKAPKKEVAKKVKDSKSSESSESSEEKEVVTKKPVERKKPAPTPTAPKKKVEAVSSEEKSAEVKKPEGPKSSGSSSGGDHKEVIKNKECRYDIVFVIDASGSLRQRYQRQLEIASKLIDKFDFGQTQIGVIRYSGRKRSKVAIPLGSKNVKEEFNHVFLNMPFMGGTTYTDEALDKAYTEITGPNVRSDALQMVIVFTDGFSQPDPAANAKKIHAKNIPTFAIGITDGQRVNEAELKSIASTPENVFLDSNIGELEKLFVQLSEHC